jgi:hypothetical protein
MKAIHNRGTALIAAGVVAFASASFMSTSAVALGKGPVDASAQLLTPILDGTNTAPLNSDGVNNQQVADGWVKNGWYGTGLVYQVTYAPSGGLFNLTYHVTDKSGLPLVNQPVILRLGKGYSSSTSMIQVDGRNTDQRGGKGAQYNALDQLDVTHNTDYFGNVTFGLQNIDDPSVGVSKPKSFNDAPTISPDGLDDFHTQALLAINGGYDIAGQFADHSVMTSIYYYKNSGAPSTVTATHPTIKLVTPVLNAANSISKSANVRQAYAQSGSSIILAYKVTDDSGAAYPNATVKLHVNTQTLTARSDVNGYVVFSIKDTHAKGESKPTSANAPVPSSGAVFSTITPEVSGPTTDVADSLELHFFGTPAVAAAKSSTISCVKGTTTVKVTGVNAACPKGYKKK